MPPTVRGRLQKVAISVRILLFFSSMLLCMYSRSARQPFRWLKITFIRSESYRPQSYRRRTFPYVCKNYLLSVVPGWGPDRNDAIML